MNIRQFWKLMNNHCAHRGSGFEADAKDYDLCTHCKKHGEFWWAVTIRGGTTFVGQTGCPHREDADFMVLRTNKEGEHLVSVLIEEIVAIAEIDEASALATAEAPSHELTSLRKEVGRLYGIVKGMERAA